LKLRNAANSAWITLFQLDGEWSTIALENGTAAAPSIYFKDSGTDTGFYSPGTDQVGISTGGTARLTIDSNGNVNIDSNTLYVDAANNRVGLGTSSPSAALHVVTSGAGQIRYFDGTVTGAFGSFGSGNEVFIGSGKALAFTTNGITSSETRITIDTTGRVGIGVTAPSDTLQVNGGVTFGSDTVLSNRTRIYESSGLRLDAGGGGLRPIVFEIGSTEKARVDTSGRLLVGTSTSVGFGAGLQLFGTSTNGYAEIVRGAASGGGPGLILTKSRNTTPGSYTIVQSGDNLGQIDFNGDDGTDYATTGAQISCQVDGTPGANDMPGRLVFSTTADGASSPTERMRIASGGRVSAPSWYDETTAVAANVNVASTGILQRSTSSIKYKTNVETIEDSYSDALLNCRPVWYRSTCANDNPNYGWWGFIAEEVAEIDPRLCLFEQKEDGNLEPEGVAYDRFVPHLLNLIKRQGEAIAELQAEVAALKGA
jgi:hypothetical protein